ncbi:MAG: DUF4058 family protein [Chloroflexi bacterium]|nr:DUF4058 family protein [Chloroflexota bacterium]
MKSPFPGMDPYLEHPALWPDVHNRLIAAVADKLSPVLRPRYYIALESRVYTMDVDDMVFVGRPDLAVLPYEGPQRVSTLPLASAGFVEVEVPVKDEIEETYLEVRETEGGQVITIVELLSPGNKQNSQGRKDYEEKRLAIFASRTNLVEIDLLRAGTPMPVSKKIQSDYRILIRRGSSHLRGQLYPFSVRQKIPAFTLPLLPGDEEPQVELNTILHDLYERASFDLRLDYTSPPVPPLNQADKEWAKELIKNMPKE